MASSSSIEWTEGTWNVARGCRKKNKDCLFCYLHRDSLKGKRYNPHVVKRTGSKTFNLPLATKDPTVFFTSSLTDIFIEEIDSYREEIWEIVRKCPHHTFQFLTKRWERIADHLPSDWGEKGYHNVWIGVSVGSAPSIEALEYLVKIKAVIRFVSFEPLHGQIPQISDRIKEQIDWIIIGGESGNEIGKYRYRPSKISWMTDLIKQFRPYKTAIFVKQLGTFLSKQLKIKGDRHGKNFENFPPELQIREMPSHVTLKKVTTNRGDRLVQHHES